MKWIFVVPGIGLFFLLAAQPLEYAVASRQLRAGRRHFPAFVEDVPPGDAQPPAEITALYDRAA